jgi:hypothetical protein
MNRTSLAFVLSVVTVVCLARAGRAAEPAAGGTAADPFASPPDGSQPASTDDDEAALLGTPARPNPPPQAPPTIAPQSPPNPPRHAAGGGRARAAQATDERSGTSAAAAETAFAIELSTSGFAAGSLQSGLFVGARMPSGLIAGGFVDYGLTSISETDTNGTEFTTSMQSVRIGAGLRHSIAHSADRMVDLYGAVDVSIDYRSAEYPTPGGSSSNLSLSATGFSLALGPGLRLWVYDQIAIGYVARFRLTHMSGSEGVIVAPQTISNIEASGTQAAFDGTFQLLGVF